MRRLALPFLLLPFFLAGCHQGYSPNTYASNAAQVEANVERGVIIGVRQVMISASGVVGAATGGAAGGVAGSQLSGGPVVTALGAIGGTLVGGVAGTAAAQTISNTKGWEYIVQEAGDKMVSVTQTSKTALPEGLHVLVISDTQQARIVPDYTMQATTQTKPIVVTNNSTTTEINLGTLSPPAAVVDSLPITPPAVAASPANLPTPTPASASTSVAPSAPSTQTTVPKAAAPAETVAGPGTPGT
ncbi:MAG: hypothetical protein KGQ26_04725 [Rhodospirillales bacterium]|nr:hypothetical protein [Rhodospirillales bacterium]MDE2318660.1 hypothetical protein [Rhodospirillales bacterium]